jgi:hypothetical protein
MSVQEERPMKTVLGSAIILLSLMVPASAGAASVHGGQATLSACTDASVQMSASWQKKSAQFPGGGAIEGAIAVNSVTGTRCSLTGWPKIRVLDAGGKRLAVQQRNIPGAVSPRPSVTLSNTAQSRKGATVHVTWMNWCKGTVSGPLYLRVRLPGGTAFRTVAIRPGGKAVASCVNPTAGSVLDVQPFAQLTG